MTENMNEKIKAHCNICKRENDHIVLYGYLTNVEHKFEDGYDGICFIQGEMIKCLGCSMISFKMGISCSNDEMVREIVFPGKIVRTPPAWLTLINSAEIRTLAEEVYSSINHGNLRVGAMGARSIIDSIALEKAAGAGTFRDKMTALKRQGLLSDKDHDTLLAVLDMGHAATHRGYSPRLYDLNKMIDILENIIKSIYVLPEVAAKLRAVTPPWVR